VKLTRITSVLVGAAIAATVALGAARPASAGLLTGSAFELQVSGTAGVPTDAVAAVLNVTVVNPSASGFVTVWPCGEPQPNASNLNFVAGQTVANLVVTKLGGGGKACFATSAYTDVLADISGYFPAGSSFSPIANPTRLLDTRDGTALPSVGANTVQQLVVADGVRVPADAKAVVVNVTVTRPAASGFLTVWPCGPTQPTASNLNFVASQTVANLVLGKVGIGGKLCLSSSATTDLIVDISGYFPATSSFTPIDSPTRLVDTRNADGIPSVPATAVQSVEVGGRATVPTDAKAVVINVTVTRAAAGGFLTVWPCGDPQPEASNLNFTPGATVPNLVIGKLGTAGKLCVVASANVDLLLDVSGYFPAGSSFVPVPNPSRLLDTRNGTGLPTSCVITTPPVGLNLPTFYTKHCNVRGLPIVANGVVSDDALRAAWVILNAMLEKRPDVVGSINAYRIHFGIIGANQVTLDMPEYTTLQFTNPETNWNTRARGLGATLSRPLVSSGEENLLCLPNDRYPVSSITIHEFAHTFLQFGVQQLDAGFRPRLAAAFNAAIAVGKWANTYSATNADEYWAEGVQDWFDSNEQAIPTNGIHNQINTRAELLAYDPALASLIAEVFPTSNFTARCPDGMPQSR
jgi:hypothetical protein